MNKKIVYFIEGRIALGLCLLFAFAVSPSFVSGQCTVSSLGIQPTRLTNKAETANKGNIPRFRSDLMPINPNLKSTASNGWSISVGDWRWYFAQTKHIHLKKGYHIEALLFYSNGNGNGYLFAWPNRVPRPQLSSKIDNAELIRKQTGDLTPVSIFENEKGKSSYFQPGFSKYARDVVSVLESDGTLDAYLELVVLIGEISDYGDEWHGCSGISFLNENEVWELVSKDELRDITDETLKKYGEKGEEYYVPS